jgi:uncharacterized protein with beta-barrel porin domain
LVARPEKERRKNFVITAAQGATFGSADAVTGDITVAGTLSPGASPGTMTVTGDVALVSGSTVRVHPDRWRRTELAEILAAER